MSIPDTKRSESDIDQLIISARSSGKRPINKKLPSFFSRENLKKPTLPIAL